MRTETRYQPTIVVSRYKIGPGHCTNWVIGIIFVIVMSFINEVSWLILPLVSLVEGRGHSIVVSWESIAISAIGGGVGHGRGGVWNSKPNSWYLIGWVDIWLPDRWRAPVTVEAMPSRPIIRVGWGCCIWCLWGGGIWRVWGGADKCVSHREGRHGHVSETTCLSRRHWASVACPDAFIGRLTATATGGAWGCLFLLGLGLLQLFKLLLNILQWKFRFQFAVLNALYDSSKRWLLFLVSVALQD